MLSYNLFPFPLIFINKNKKYIIMKITLTELRQLVKNVIKEEMAKVEKEGYSKMKKEAYSKMKMEGEMEGEDEMSKEEKAVEVLDRILKPSEIEFLKKQYKELGKSGFKDEVNALMNLNEEEEEEMTEDEFKLRNIVNKIIKKGTVLSAIGIVPAAIFSGGTAAVGLGIATLVGTLLKDAAFWTKKGVDYKKLKASDEEMEK